MKRFRFAWLAIASAVSVSAIVHAARPQYGGTLRVESRATLHTLDPGAEIADRDAASLVRRMRPLVFETLVHIDPAGGLRPLLAVAWESDARSLRWRFRLRPGVVLHDGTPLESWQVAASLRSAAPAWTISNDADAVVIQGTTPQPDLPWELSDSRYAIAVRRSASDLAGTGPFRVERLDDTGAMLRAHDRYWAGRPFVDAVTIDMNRGAAAQLADLEAGRADVVDLQPADSRRVTQRGFHVVSSRALDLFVLVFEPHRAGASAESLRRALAGVIDREPISAVVLQGQANPARSLLPPWLSGYAAGVVAPLIPRTTRASAGALTPDQRTLTVRVDPADTAARAIADRIAEDAREAGFVLTVQAPAGLAPRPDLRLVRAALEPSSPDRTLARLIGTLGVHPPASQPSTGDTVDAVAHLEQALLADLAIVPIVHVPHLYATSDAIDVWDGAAVTATGEWNFASVWIRGKQP